MVTIPKMLRVCFLHHRELLGELSRAAYQTIQELLAAAVVEDKGFRPGVVTVVQTFGDRVNFHPHVHALATRGGWSASGEWIGVAQVDEGAAERLFQHKLPRMLREKGLVSEQRIELLLSWRRSGFSVHNRVRVSAGDASGLEALARYLMCSPVSLSRMQLDAGRGEVVYAHKNGHDSHAEQGEERVDAMEFIARLLVQIPEPRRHNPRYYSFYSNAARGSGATHVPRSRVRAHPRLEPRARTKWIHPTRLLPGGDALADLLRRIYEVDPLVCRCGGTMRVISFITEPRVIERILDHLRRQKPRARGSPGLIATPPALA